MAVSKNSLDVAVDELMHSQKKKVKKWGLGQNVGFSAYST